MASKNCSAKRTKKYRPRDIRLNTMKVALAHKAYLSADERQIVVREARVALENLRTGNLSREDWVNLCDCANIGLELSKAGICSDEASRNLISAMCDALAELAKRFNAQGRVTARGAELQAIREGVERHDIQLEYCSGDDLVKAVAAHEKLKAHARAGRIAFTTISKAKTNAEVMA